MTKIALMAGEIWLLLDKFEGVTLSNLFKRLETSDKDFILMALGWLVYEKHVKWIKDEDGGRLFLVVPKEKEGLKNEESDQNRFVVNNA